MTARATDEEVLHAARGQMTVKRGDGTLTLSWRWFSARRFFIMTLLYCAPSGLFLIEPELWSLNPISVIVLGLAACGLYGGATQLLESTTVEVDRQRLRVRHGPLYWPGRKELLVSQLSQLFVGWDVYVAPRSGARSYTFTLRAKLKDGGEEVLVGGPISADRAKALESVLEKQLGITNVPVSAEWNR